MPTARLRAATEAEGNEIRAQQERVNARMACIPTRFPNARWMQRYVSVYFRHEMFFPHGEFGTRYIRILFLKEFATESERYLGMMELEEVFRYMEVPENPIRVVPNWIDRIWRSDLIGTEGFIMTAPAFEWNITLRASKCASERAAKS